MKRLPAKYDAVTNYTVLDKWDLYSNGFKKAGFYLIDKLIQDFDNEANKVEWDELIYPICFNFRQYIELRLKNIVIGKYGESEGLKICTLCSHHLDKLWDVVKPIFSERYKESLKTETTEHLERLILGFSKADNNSEAFRYPVNIKGAVSLSAGLINCKDLRQEMEYITNCLDSLYWTFYRTDFNT